MNDRRLGMAVRARRHLRGWRLIDLAAAAGVGATQCGLVERGLVGRLTVQSARKVAAAVGIDLEWDIGWQDQEVRRLLDADHAALMAALIRLLSDRGWGVRSEVSFNRYGDRGRIDVLAYQPAHRVLLVVEVKTALIDAQQLLGSLDVKRRVAPFVAAEAGWRPRALVPAIVIADGTTARRRLAAVQPLFARYSLRSGAARRWLREPLGTPDGLLLFTNLPFHAGSDVRRAARRRVRVIGGNPRSAAAEGRAANARLPT
jgi:transcriptional regulator with XRE-family HTH domain